MLGIDNSSLYVTISPGMDMESPCSAGYWKESTMKVDDIKIALKRSDGAHQSVVRALKGDRMVIFKGNLLLVEQEDGLMKQFHLGRYLTPQDRGLGGVKPYYVEVEG